MKKLQYFVPQSRHITKNSESRYIINYLVECKDPVQQISITCTDEDKNEVEEIVQLFQNTIFYCFDCTDFMTICNPDNKHTKAVRYKVFSMTDSNKTLEIYGTVTLLQ